ncbi:MAG: phage tail protein [Afipia sp.]|nr:phage tail protein [Afipia sp.]
MPLDVFNPPLAPSTPSVRPVRPRVNEATFGDGYSQRSGDGLNANPRTFQAQWSMLEDGQADAIEAFFETHTKTAFLWTVPLEIVQRKWIAVDWSRGYLGADLVSLSANLKEVFDL